MLLSFNICIDIYIEIFVLFIRFFGKHLFHQYLFYFISVPSFNLNIIIGLNKTIVYCLSHIYAYY